MIPSCDQTSADNSCDWHQRMLWHCRRVVSLTLAAGTGNSEECVIMNWCGVGLCNCQNLGQVTPSEPALSGRNWNRLNSPFSRWVIRSGSRCPADECRNTRVPVYSNNNEMIIRTTNMTLIGSWYAPLDPWARNRGVACSSPSTAICSRPTSVRVMAAHLKQQLSPGLCRGLLCDKRGTAYMLRIVGSCTINMQVPIAVAILICNLFSIFIPAPRPNYVRKNIIHMIMRPLQVLVTTTSQLFTYKSASEWLRFSGQNGTSW